MSKLYELITNYKNLRNTPSNYSEIVNRFDWSNMIDIYDKTFEKYYNN